MNIHTIHFDKNIQMQLLYFIKAIAQYSTVTLIMDDEIKNTKCILKIEQSNIN